MSDEEVVKLTDTRSDRKPETHNGDLRNLPTALEPLKPKARWVLWRWEYRNGRWTKPPLQPSGRYASADDDSTWHTYAEVVDQFGGAFDGIGYVLGDGDIAIDIDHCRDAATGNIHPWALALVEKMNTYAEVSPSGTGLRIIGGGGGDAVHCKVPVTGAHGVSCEFYRKAVRYVTVTGNKLEGSADVITAIETPFDETCAELSAASTGSRDDGGDELWRTIRDGGGDRYEGDRSRAFYAVLNGLMRRGYSRAKIAKILLAITGNPIADHIGEQGGGPAAYVERQIDKAIREAEFTTDKHDKPLATTANIRIAMLKLGATVRHDKFALRDLVDGVEGFGPFLDDAAANRLWITIDQRFGLRASREVFFIVLSDTARVNEFHPVIDYLDSLKWDSAQRLDRWLTTYGGAEDNEYTRAVGALVLTAAVRRVKRPGCKFDELVVLEGDQGTERSSAVAILAIKPDWFSDDLPMGADAQRVIERMSGKWIIEAAELDGMRKAEVEHLKAFLSRRYDRARMAYGRLPVEAARQCVIIGTTNASKYLKDTTGNRRYWPVAIKKFDTEALTRDRDQLWAEAVVRERAGDSIRLDQTLWIAAAEAQVTRLVDDPFYDALFDAIGNLQGKIAGESVWEVLDLRVGQRTQEHNRRMGDAMRRLGWHRPVSMIRIDGKATRGYVKGPQPWEQITVIRPVFDRTMINVTGGRPVEGDGETYQGESPGSPEAPTS